MSSSDAEPTCDSVGVKLHWRFTGRTKNAPTTTRRINGSSLATVSVSTMLTPERTPRMLSAASPPKSRISNAACGTGAASAGSSAARDPTNTIATAALATVWLHQNSTPERNPGNGPNAVSIYAYRPPGADTLLPASAKLSAMSPAAIAQTI